MVYPDSPAPDGGSVQPPDDLLGDGRKDLHQREGVPDFYLPYLGSLYARFAGNGAKEITGSYAVLVSHGHEETHPGLGRRSAPLRRRSSFCLPVGRSVCRRLLFEEGKCRCRYFNGGVTLKEGLHGQVVRAQFFLFEGLLQQTPQALQLSGHPSGNGFLGGKQGVAGFPGHLPQMGEFTGTKEDDSRQLPTVPSVQGVGFGGNVHTHRNHPGGFVHPFDDTPGSQLVHGEPNGKIRFAGGS
jgi:hypothetical protein